MLNSAVVSRFGFQVDVQYKLQASQLLCVLNLFIFNPLAINVFQASQPNSAQVENNGGCQRMLADHFPETCMMGDVLHMGKTEKTHWEMASHFQCITHDNLYPGQLFGIKALLLRSDDRLESSPLPKQTC